MVKFNIFVCFGFILLASCTYRISLKDDYDSSESYKNCYHENFIVDENSNFKWTESISKFIPNYDTIKSNSIYELFYSEHCFECSDKDRYSIFTFVNEKKELTVIKVIASGEVYYCNTYNLDVENFYSNILSIKGKLVSRDCADLDVVNTDFFVRDVKENKIISYFQSIGLEGNILDNTNSYYRQVLIIRDILNFPWECSLKCVQILKMFCKPFAIGLD